LVVEEEAEEVEEEDAVTWKCMDIEAAVAAKIVDVICSIEKEEETHRR
jgi:hypothetical protein